MFPVKQGPRHIQYQDEGLHFHGCLIQEDAQVKPRKEVSSVCDFSRTWYVQRRGSMDPLQ